MNENFIGIELIDREGDGYKINSYDNETQKYLGRQLKNQDSFFPEYVLSEDELKEELNDQPIREKFYKYTVIM